MCLNCLLSVWEEGGILDSIMLGVLCSKMKAESVD